MIGRALDLLQARMLESSLPDETVSMRGRLIIRDSTQPVADPPDC
jgi:DNA-binding LacI/PurR family transcriptional regulator